MSDGDEDLLADLLLGWEEAQERGRDVAAAELCRDCPHLACELANRIAALKETAWLDRPLETPPLQAEPVPPVLPPARLLAGRYRLDELIGEGGFAWVWKGYDQELQRVVAIKVPGPGRLGSVESFLAEARRVAQLKHPGIVPIFDVGRQGDLCFLVLEYVEGGSLADRVRRRPLPPSEAARLVAEVAEALHHAHQLGFVHRDVKPGNILLDRHGRARLADFGIAVAAQDAGPSALGTPAYVSPEQGEGKPVDGRSDLYSLGVVLNELLNGSAHPGRVPAALKRIGRKLLARDPAARGRTAGELAAALRHFLASDGGTANRRKVVGAALAVLLLGAGLGIGLRVHSDRPPDAVDGGRELRCFEGRMGQVLGVAFSPDGRCIVTGDIYRGLRRWDAESGAEREPLAGHADWVRAVTFSPDGRWVLSCSGGWTPEGVISPGDVRLWDAATGAERCRCTGHTAPIVAIAFSPDGKRFLSGSDDSTMRLWSAGDGREVRCFRGHRGLVRSVVFCPDNRRAFSGSVDGTVRLWDVDSGAELRRFAGHAGGVECVACSAGGRWAASAGKDNAVRLWDVETGREVRCLEGHRYHVTAVRFSPDDRFLLSGSLDGTVRLWEAASGKEVCCLTGHKSGVTCVAFSPDGRRGVSGSEDGTARLWSLPLAPPIATAGKEE